MKTVLIAVVLLTLAACASTGTKTAAAVSKGDHTRKCMQSAHFDDNASAYTVSRCVADR